MTIEAFIIAWNEEDIIGHTVRHYKCQFGAKVNIFDNYSTDRTREIAEANGAHVESFGKPGVLDDEAYLDIKNHIWKNSHADFVIVCDADELLVPKSHDVYTNLFDSGETVIWPRGWDVYSEKLPTPASNILDINTGYEFSNYGKRIMFDRRAITEINYRPGCHSCDPHGTVKYSDINDWTLLHYRCIGGVERQIARYHEYQKRKSAKNRQSGWGVHYDKPDEQLRKEWAVNIAKSKPLW